MTRALALVIVAACSSSSPRANPPPTGRATGSVQSPGDPAALDAPASPAAPVDAGMPDALAIATSCPATLAAATGACKFGGTCSVGNSVCTCESPRWCGGAPPPPNFGQPAAWVCRVKPGPRDCPLTQPAPGSACQVAGQTCDYTCNCILSATCANGTWAIKNGPCKPAAPPHR